MVGSTEISIFEVVRLVTWFVVLLTYRVEHVLPHSLSEINSKANV